MGSHHYPILTWQDASGWFTASLVGDLEGAAANGSTPEEAVLQLKELLDWRVDHEPWAVDSEVREAVLIEVKVEVRPEWQLVSASKKCGIWDRRRCFCSIGFDGKFRETFSDVSSGADKA